MPPDSPHSPTALLVLGMHRSGTSALTRLLHLLGAHLPANLMPANPYNVTGHWEPQDLSALHDEILASLGSAWDSLTPVPDDWHTTPAAVPFHNRALAILRRDFSNSPLFAIKDPRVSLLLPFWRSLLADFGAHPRLLLSLRNPLDVAASLARRDGFPTEKSLLLWLRYTLDAERHSRSAPRILLPYDSLLADWRAAASVISHTLAITFPRPFAAAAPEIDAFLSPDHRHHHHTLDSLQADPAIPSWIKLPYAALLSSQDPAPACDAARAAFDEARRLFTPLLSAQPTTSVSPAALAALQVDHDRLLADLTAARSDISRLHAVLSDEKRALLHAHDQLAAARAPHPLPALNGHPSPEPPPAPAPIPHPESAPRKRSFFSRRAAPVSVESPLPDAPFPPLDLPKGSPFFDEPHYLKQLGVAVPDPLHHYLTLGASRGLDPHWLFHSAYYLEMNPDAAGQNPLSHFLHVGAKNLRNPHPLFDMRFYLQTNPDVASAGVNPLEHFLVAGWKENRSPNRFFNLQRYLQLYPDVSAAGLNALYHFSHFGFRENRSPSPLFDCAYYIRFNPEYALSGLDPLSHFLWHGLSEGRLPLPPHKLLRAPSLSSRRRNRPTPIA